EERERSAAHEVLEASPLEPLDRGYEDLNGWLRTVHAHRTRGDRGNAAVHELVPNHGGEGRVQQGREAERECEHAREQTEVEIGAQQVVAGQVEALAPALEREHADDDDDRD